MGYTHYYTMHADGDQKEWAAALILASAIINNSPVPLGDALGEGDGPEFTEEWLALNGVGEDSYETFELPTILLGNDGPNFTKTARKPYDVVVTAVLATIAQCAPSCISVSSDGSEDDWADGVALARAILCNDNINVSVGV